MQIVFEDGLALAVYYAATSCHRTSACTMRQLQPPTPEQSATREHRVGSPAGHCIPTTANNWISFLPGFCLQLELTDGWYWVNAICDEPLSSLARAGRIMQGKQQAHGTACLGTEHMGWSWDRSDWEVLCARGVKGTRSSQHSVGMPQTHPLLQKIAQQGGDHLTNTRWPLCES